MIQVIDVNSGELLGPNQKGEICIQGDNVMKGYLGNPEATKQALQDGWLHSGINECYNQ